MPEVIIIGNPLANTYCMARSLHKHGIKPVLFLEPTAYKGLKYSRFFSTIHTLAHLEDVIGLLLELYGNESDKPILLCGSDPAVCILDANYNLLKDKFVFFNAGKEGRINTLMDKLTTFPLAEQNQFNLIKTWSVKYGDNVPDDIIYPCIIKGNNSTKSSKMDMTVCYNQTQLQHSIKEGIDYLIQEYIEKEYELDIIGLALNGGKDVVIPGAVRKIRDNLQRQSDFVRLDDITVYKSLDITKIAGLIKDIGYEGIFSVELMFAKGKYYFLEVNLRNDGCCWLYTVGGINYPYLWTLYGQSKLSPKTIAELNLKAPVYLMQRNDLYNLLERKLSFKQWLSDFYKTDTFFNAHFSDPLLFFYDTAIHIRQAGKKILRKLFGVKFA